MIRSQKWLLSAVCQKRNRKVGIDDAFNETARVESQRRSPALRKANTATTGCMIQVNA